MRMVVNATNRNPGNLMLARLLGRRVRESARNTGSSIGLQQRARRRTKYRRTGSAAGELDEAFTHRAAAKNSADVGDSNRIAVAEQLCANCRAQSREVARRIV